VLEEELGRLVSLFCYPNGDSSPRAYEQVKACYEGAMSTQPGWHLPGDDPFMVNRIGVHGDVSRSPREIVARVSGRRGL